MLAEQLDASVPIKLSWHFGYNLYSQSFGNMDASIWSSFWQPKVI